MSFHGIMGNKEVAFMRTTVRMRKWYLENREPFPSGTPEWLHWKGLLESTFLGIFNEEYETLDKRPKYERQKRTERAAGFSN